MKLSDTFHSLAVCMTASLLIPSTAMAQDTTGSGAPEEIVITGQYGDVPDSVSSLSYPVSYADLDLSTDDGRDILRKRVRHTARFLCEKLGEADVSSPLVPSCQDAAVRASSL